MIIIGIFNLPHAFAARWQYRYRCQQNGLLFIKQPPSTSASWRGTDVFRHHIRGVSCRPWRWARKSASNDTMPTTAQHLPGMFTSPAS